MNQVLDNPQIKEAMAAIVDLKMSLKNQDAIAAASEQVTASLNAFAVLNDGSTLSAIDSLIAKEEDYKMGSVKQE